ncbi:MAG: AIR synthase-related protein, partial [Bacteroidetes bacterium]|nr:AIR synthase-related protein [Bacteroidota bacterium]
VAAMHDVTEGGVIGALHEMAEASGTGIEVWSERIPVRPETQGICSFFEADPLRLVGSGAMLIAGRDGAGLVTALAAAGIPAAVVGRATAGGRVLHQPEGDAELVPPERDELWRILERFGETNGDS